MLEKMAKNFIRVEDSEDGELERKVIISGSKAGFIFEQTVVKFPFAWIAISN